MNRLTRQQFLQCLGAAATAGLGFMPRTTSAQVSGTAAAPVPTCLKDYAAAYSRDPRAAAVLWHRNAKWVLFVHSALHSLRGLTAKDAQQAKATSNAQWKKLKQGTPEEYAKLKERFTAEKFDADFITDLALAAEMHYVNFTTRHLGDLYMFRTSVSEFTSLNSPARRDLVAELAEQCRKKG